MRLKELAKKPTLVQITLDQPEIIEKYGEPLEFYSWDRQPLDDFLKVAVSNGDNEIIMDMVKKLVLDENGNPILEDGMALPKDVLVHVMNKMVEILGK